MLSPELKPHRGAGRRGVPGHCGGQQRGPHGGKEDENQAWLAMLEKATNSVRYISRHIKKEHFIREVGVAKRETRCGTNWVGCVLHHLFTVTEVAQSHLHVPNEGCFTVKKMFGANTDSHLCTFVFLCLSLFHQVVQDWKFVAQVLDRIFLWAFLTVSILGTILIFTPALQMYLSTPSWRRTLKLMNTIQQFVLGFQSVFNYDLLIKLNETFILYLSIVETSPGNKLLPPYNMVCSL